MPEKCKLIRMTLYVVDYNDYGINAHVVEHEINKATDALAFVCDEEIREIDFSDEIDLNLPDVTKQEYEEYFR